MTYTQRVRTNTANANANAVSTRKYQSIRASSAADVRADATTASATAPPYAAAASAADSGDAATVSE